MKDEALGGLNGPVTASKILLSVLPEWKGTEALEAQLENGAAVMVTQHREGKL